LGSSCSSGASAMNTTTRISQYDKRLPPTIVSR